MYFWSASVLWTLEHYMRCNTQSSDMGWHPLCHPTLSFLTSETRINITNGHNPHTAHHQEGSCLFVYIYSITGIKEFCQSQVKRESIYLLILVSTFSSSEWPSNCYNSHLDPVLQQGVNNAVSVKLFVWCPDNSGRCVLVTVVSPWADCWWRLGNFMHSHRYLQL